MSRLDDILRQTSVNISQGLVTGTWTRFNTKQAIKDLMLELIGEDNKVGDPAKDSIVPMQFSEVVTQNNLRTELRKKVAEL